MKNPTINVWEPSQKEKKKRERNKLQNKITVPTELERKKMVSALRRTLVYRVVSTKFRVCQ